MKTPLKIIFVLTQKQSEFRQNPHSQKATILNKLPNHSYWACSQEIHFQNHIWVLIKSCHIWRPVSCRRKFWFWWFGIRPINAKHACITMVLAHIPCKVRQDYRTHFKGEKCRIQDRERRIYALKYLHAVQGVLDEVQSNKFQTRHSKQRDVK